MGHNVEFEKNDVLGLINLAIHSLIDELCMHGDGPIPKDPSILLCFEFNTVEFLIYPYLEPPDQILTYNDTTAILDAFSLKMSREGYSHRFAVVLSSAADLLAESSITRHPG